MHVCAGLSIWFRPYVYLYVYVFCTLPVIIHRKILYSACSYDLYVAKDAVDS